MKRIWLSLAMGAVASAFLLAPAQAAPIGVTNVATAAGANVAVEKVNYRYSYHRHRYHRHHVPVLRFFKPHRHHHYYRRWR